MVPIEAATSRTPIDSSPCVTDDDDLIARRDVGAGHVDHRHVHAHRADDGHAAAANEHEAAAGEAEVEAVGVAGGHDGKRPRLGHRRLDAVAGALARPKPFTATIRLWSDSAGRNPMVVASGGGTTP